MWSCNDGSCANGQTWFLCKNVMILRILKEWSYLDWVVRINLVVKRLGWIRWCSKIMKQKVFLKMCVSTVGALWCLFTKLKKKIVRMTLWLNIAFGRISYPQENRELIACRFSSTDFYHLLSSETRRRQQMFRCLKNQLSDLWMCSQKCRGDCGSSCIW